MIWTESPERWVLWFQIYTYYHHLTLSHFNAPLQDWLKYLLLGEGKRLLGLKTWKWKLLSLVRSLVNHGLYSPWNSPGQNTRWVDFPYSRGSYQFRDQAQASHIEGGFCSSWATRKPKNAWVGSLSFLHQSFTAQELNWCLQLCRQNLSQLSYQESPEMD